MRSDETGKPGSILLSASDMDFELTRTLTHAVLKSMLAQSRREPGYARQFVGDMQFVSIALRVERLAREQGHIQPTISLSIAEQNYVSHSLWELVIQGILVPNPADGGGQGWPFVSFTEYGETAINAESPTPYDPSAYPASFAVADPGARFYIEEALGCFRANRHTACAVMLGVASDRLFDLLFDCFIGALASKTERENLTKKTDGKFITIRYDELKKRLDPKKPQLPQALRDNLDTTLTSIFNLIRQQRNDAGHPTGRTITRDEAYALLYVFPHYHSQLTDLIGYLMEHPTSLT